MFDALLEFLYFILFVLLFARMILSFTNLSYYHPIRQTVDRLTEPLLAPFRRILPPTAGMDFSPLAVMLIAYILKEVLQNFL
jgi:YggT family protein